MQAKADNGVAASEQPFQLAEHSDQRGEMTLQKVMRFGGVQSIASNQSRRKTQKVVQNGAFWCMGRPDP